MNTLTESQIKALNDAADIMDTERQELLRFLEGLGAKLSRREDKISQFGGAVPHRVEIAISNERERLGAIAKELLSLIPRNEEPEESLIE